MSWDLFVIVKDNLVDYVFGSEMVFSIALIFVFMLFLMVARVNPLVSFTLIVPLFVASVVSGYFGAALWVKAAVMLALASIWTFVLWKLLGD
jgi:general stress protein CsbA